MEFVSARQNQWDLPQMIWYNKFDHIYVLTFVVVHDKDQYLVYRNRTAYKLITSPAWRGLQEHWKIMRLKKTS